MTPTRRVSFAPRTLVEARAVSPLAMRKLRRFGLKDMALLSICPDDLISETRRMLHCDTPPVCLIWHTLKAYNKRCHAGRVRDGRPLLDEGFYECNPARS